MPAEPFGPAVPDQLSPAASIGFLSLTDEKAQITQQRNANGVVKSDLPKTVINAWFAIRVRLHNVDVMTRVCVVGSVNMRLAPFSETHATSRNNLTLECASALAYTPSRRPASALPSPRRVVYKMSHATDKGGLGPFRRAGRIEKGDVGYGS